MSVKYPSVTLISTGLYRPDAVLSATAPKHCKVEAKTTQATALTFAHVDAIIQTEMIIFCHLFYFHVNVIC